MVTIVGREINDCSGDDKARRLKTAFNNDAKNMDYTLPTFIDHTLGPQMADIWPPSYPGYLIRSALQLIIVNSRLMTNSWLLITSISEIRHTNNHRFSELHFGGGGDDDDDDVDDDGDSLNLFQ